MVKIPNNTDGFTIIEAIIAILVLTMGLVPVLFFATSILNVSSNIRNNLIAANLAQEGIEVVRAIRDRDWLLGNGFNNGQYLSTPDTWRVQYNSDAPINLGANPPLKVDLGGIYNYSDGTDTQFRRTITVTEIASNVELMVVSEVTWPSRGGATVPGCPVGTRCVKAESHLYNWR
jgi:type II secretory pathway pseudopilin PulG